MALSFEAAYRLADERMDEGDKDAAHLLNFCAASAEAFHRLIGQLAYASLQPSAAKRRQAVATIKAALDAQGYDTAMMPLEYSK